jgi:hypothetical protein
MTKILSGLCAFLLCASMAAAQDVHLKGTWASPPPGTTVDMPSGTTAAQQPPPAVPVSTPVVASCAQANIGVEYIHFSNGMSGLMEEAAHPFTDCSKKYILSLGFAMIQVPPASTSFYVIGPRVDLPLANIWPKLDQALTSVTLFAGGGLGTAQISPANLTQTNHFAYGAHGGVTISPGSIFGVSTQLQIEGGVVGYRGNVFKATVLPNASGQIAAAVIFNLGKKAPPSAAQQAANARP